MPATYLDYRPETRPNPMAAHRALFHAERCGSASAALEQADVPGTHDADIRALCEELRQMQHMEWVAAKAAAQDARLAA